MKTQKRCGCARGYSCWKCEGGGPFDVFAIACVLLVSACAPSTRPPCDTSDLDAQYYDDLIAACWDFNGPLHECPGSAKIAHDYEEKATARCTRK